MYGYINFLLVFPPLWQYLFLKQKLYIWYCVKTHMLKCTAWTENNGEKENVDVTKNTLHSYGIVSPTIEMGWGRVKQRAKEVKGKYKSFKQHPLLSSTSHYNHCLCRLRTYPFFFLSLVFLDYHSELRLHCIWLYSVLLQSFLFSISLLLPPFCLVFVHLHKLRSMQYSYLESEWNWWHLPAFLY